MRRLLAAVAGIAFLAAPAAAQFDGSGTITTGGTAQQVFPVGGSMRSFLLCQNPIAATEPLLVNTPGPAGVTNGSIELAPGGSITFNGPFTPQGPVSVYAATTGHRFICKQG